MGQFCSNFQELLLGHVPLRPNTDQEVTCPPRLHLHDLEDGWVLERKLTKFRCYNNLKISPNHPDIVLKWL